MRKPLKHFLLAGCALLAGTAVMAKLPALSDEAKVKAAEAAAKTAWSGKVEGYQLCKSQDRTAAYYKKTKTGEKEARPAVKDVKPPVAAGACVDPGPFVYTPAVLAAAPAAAPAPVAAATPATAPPAKKP